MVSEKIFELREKCRNGYYARFRKEAPDYQKIRDEIFDLTEIQADAHILKRTFELETPVIIPGERLQYTRSFSGIIPYLTAENLRKQNPGFRTHIFENLSPDYGMLLKDGLLKRQEKIRQQLKNHAQDSKEYQYLSGTAGMIDSTLAFAERYAEAADAAGETELAHLLRKVPAHPAETMQEALQSIYFYNAVLRLAAHIHIGFGRFDQYMIDFYRNDIANGRETKESAEDLIAEFFLALCRDYDLYHGVQRGDNGQSLMLGGCDGDGNPSENELTLLVMDVSAQLKMIDPKINLRVNRNSSAECLKKAVNLSGCGLGFPQFSNDDVVIPGLVDFGYDLRDARDYYVAACWEFVVPHGRDIPNINGVNLAYTSDRAIRKMLREKRPFEQLQNILEEEIREITNDISSAWNNCIHLQGPLFSLLDDGCIEKGSDLNDRGGKHHHYGLHCCGSSTAADSIAAVKHFVYDTGEYTQEEFLQALESNFEHHEELRIKLKTASCKTGCGSADADTALKLVFDTCAGVIEQIKDNTRGGRVRPGCGSAMYYAWFTQDERQKQYLKATADGRREKEYISASISPAPGVRANGMLSILKSFSCIDYNRICNGGPITMEFEPACFSTPENREKMTALIRAFVNSGCQQLQWNVLDPDVLRHAQKYPEQHRDLVVRVWGWSGFFVELDPVFQEQIIGRTSYRE